jgi:hypothetical protein
MVDSECGDFLRILHGEVPEPKKFNDDVPRLSAFVFSEDQNILQTIVLYIMHVFM